MAVADGGSEPSVLVPVDGSSLSYRALRHALRRYPEAAITVLHVVDLFEPEPPGFHDAETTFEPLVGTEEWYDHAERISEMVLEDAVSVAEDADRAVATATEIGEPGRVVVDYATEEDVDHVVLGAHAREPTRRPVFGSVAEVVVRRSPCSVTVVR